MVQGKIVIISGPSGVGKNTIIEALRADSSLDLKKVTTYTTREKREGEQEGRDHFYVDKKDFLALYDQGEILEYNVYNQHYYGTPKTEIEKAFSEGGHPLLEIDVNGALTVKERFPEKTLLIFVKCEAEVLKRRLQMRGCHTDEAISERLEEAERELVLAERYDHIVENIDGKLEVALTAIKNILTKTLTK